MAVTVAGVDGCRGGWYAVTAQASASALQGQVWTCFADLVRGLDDALHLAVDMPIGLPERGSRACDVLVRAHLGARGASVFAAPLRGMLAARTYAEANALRRGIEGKGMSIQAYNILPKVREVDAVLRRSSRDAARTFETHPEACFVALNCGQPLPAGKKTAPGRAVRQALLEAHFGDEVQRLLDERPRAEVQADDVLDALACLWSAQRGLRGETRRWPGIPEVDACGLAMAIHA